MRNERHKLCYPNYNKNGVLISYRFFYTGKDPLSGAPKQFTKCWKVPTGLTAKEIERERRAAEIAFIQEAEKKSLGTYIPDTNVLFGDFADQWLETVKLRSDSGYSSYESAKTHLPILKAHFGNCLLRNITPRMIQSFYNYLTTRTYTKSTVTVKKSIQDLLREHKLNKTTAAKACGIGKPTFAAATVIGKKVSLQTAQKICGYFKIPIDRYFTVETVREKYSVATNRGIRTLLVMILNSARKQQLIEYNYATKEYTEPIKGTEKGKRFYSDSEARRFLQLTMEEKDIRKKTVFSLFLYLGLRNAELCGLEWQDIDFEQGTLTVSRNSIYFSDFGVCTKAPKTQNSARTVSMPPKLIELLHEYKEWWDDQKEQHGDLWQESKRLFLNDNGKPIHPSTPSNWLEKFQAEHGLAHVSPHALRHTSITLQVMAGIPIKAVSQRAGHANEAITLNIYTHLLQEEDRRAAAKFDTYLSPQ